MAPGGRSPVKPMEFCLVLVHRFRTVSPMDGHGTDCSPDPLMSQPHNYKGRVGEGRTACRRSPIFPARPQKAAQKTLGPAGSSGGFASARDGGGPCCRRLVVGYPTSLFSDCSRMIRSSLTVASLGRSHFRTPSSNEGGRTEACFSGSGVLMASPRASTKTPMRLGTSLSSIGVDATQRPSRQ
jgi:hypothetical protein